MPVPCWSEWLTRGHRFWPPGPFNPFRLHAAETPPLAAAAQPTFSALGCESLRFAEAQSFLEANKTRVPPQVQQSFSAVTPVTQSSGDFCCLSACAKASGSDRRRRARHARLRRRRVENCRRTGTVLSEFGPIWTFRNPCFIDVPCGKEPFLWRWAAH